MFRITCGKGVILLLLLLVGFVLAAEEKAAKPTESKKVIDTKDVKKTATEPKKSRTGKRDSSDQEGSFATNPNDEPFRPMIARSNADIYEAAAATHKATFYDKNQLTTKTTPANDGGGNNVQQKRQHQKQQQQQHQQFSAHDAIATTATKDATINRQATAAPGAAYQRPYSQVAVAYQQPQEQQPSLVTQHKQIVRVVGKNNGQQQKDIQYVAAPPPHSAPHPHQHNGPPVAAFNYERLPLQYLQQQLQQHLIERGPGHQRPQQVQYIIAIPMSYLRQLQQQQQQQQQQHHQQSHLPQQNNGHQQQSIPQLHAFAIQPGYSIAAGPLARDHQGTYRPVHRFSPTAINNVQQINAGGQHQATHHSASAPAPPGYITQYIQVPASALLAAAQAAQVYQRPASSHSPASPAPASTPQQVVYQHQPAQQQQQEPILQQQPQYYYYPQQQHQHQPPQQLKPAPPAPSHAASSPPLAPASPPLYAYQIQEQQPTQQYEQHQQAPSPVQYQVQHLQPEQQQQLNVVGKQPDQALYRQPHQHQHHPHGQQESAQVVAVPQELAQKTLAPPPPPPPAAPVVPEHSYEPVVHYNPQYLVQYEQPQHQQKHHLKYQQQPQLQLQHVHINPSHLTSNPPTHALSPQPHRFQLQAAPSQPQPPPPSPTVAQQQTTIVDNLNNLPYSQATIQGPTPVPFTHLAPPALGGPTLHIGPPPPPPAAAMTPYYHHPLLPNTLQPAFAPLGIPSKVTSFTNVLLQPFAHGHGPTYQTTPEIGPIGSALPYFNHAGGIQYGSHLYHPPTSVSAIVNKVAAPAVASPAAAIRTSAKGSSATAKAPGTDGSRTIVKYP
ncbi:uncharacterized protein LOC101889826 [Musca domestica]|uniref:Uncharacterized protein LOC101889826 n=1 Tax=Musca domestica TaxID=7370 RepID=A0ABM3UTF7_MUSDO|nr:uncharacterized protein LOC101889826 [Musca domestica]